MTEYVEDPNKKKLEPKKESKGYPGMEEWKFLDNRGPKLKAQESFKWAAGIPELENIPANSKIVRIRGKAGEINAVSKNKRLYCESELKASARTWVQKPVTLNHLDCTNPKNKVGQVVAMELDSDGKLEYIADVWKEPYVTMLRNKSAAIHGVSLEAGYWAAECIHCQKRFPTEEAYFNHLEKDHFMHSLDRTIKPYGIIGTALSLVLNEEPGLETSIQVMETVNGFMSLMETFIKDQHPDVAEAAIVGLTPVTSYVVGAKLKEEPKVIGEPCSPELRACVDKLIADGKEESSAWAICKAQLGETTAASHKNPVPGPKLTEADLRNYQVEVDKYLVKVDIELAEKTKTIEVLQKQLADAHSLKETAEKNLIQENVKLKQANEQYEYENTFMVNQLSHIRGNFKGKAKETVQRNVEYAEDPNRKPRS